MVKLLLTIILLFIVNLVFSQPPPTLAKGTSKYKNNPIAVITANKKYIGLFYNCVLNPNSIDSVKVQKSSDYYTKLYDKRANDGIIFIKMKHNTNFLTLKEIYSKFKISKKYHSLPVFIDSTITLYPEKAYFQENAVKTIKVQKESETGLMYISILSVNPTRHPKPGEIYIR